MLTPNSPNTATPTYNIPLHNTAISRLSPSEQQQQLTTSTTIQPTSSNPANASSLSPLTIHPFFLANTYKRKRNTVKFTPDKRRTHPDLAGEPGRTDRTDGPPESRDCPVIATTPVLHVTLSDISDISPTLDGPTFVIYDPLSNSSASMAARRTPAPSKLSHDKRLDIS